MVSGKSSCIVLVIRSPSRLAMPASMLRWPRCPGPIVPHLAGYLLKVRDRFLEKGLMASKSPETAGLAHQFPTKAFKVRLSSFRVGQEDAQRRPTAGAAGSAPPGGRPPPDGVGSIAAPP